MSEPLAKFLPRSMLADFERVSAGTGYPVESLIAGRIAWEEIKRLPTRDERDKAVATIIQLWRLDLRDRP